MIISATTDYREAARRRLPPFLFHYIDGGAYAEHTLGRNVSDLSEVALRQRVLRDVADSTDISMLIVTHEMQFARDVSHKVMMFDEGHIVEEGHPDTIFTSPKHERTKRFLSAVLGDGSAQSRTTSDD